MILHLVTEILDEHPVPASVFKLEVIKGFVFRADVTVFCLSLLSRRFGWYRHFKVTLQLRCRKPQLSSRQLNLRALLKIPSAISERNVNPGLGSLLRMFGYSGLAALKRNNIACVNVKRGLHVL